MPLRTADRLIGNPRGRAHDATDFAWAEKAARISDVEDYCQEVYRVAALVGIDPAIAIAQSVHETTDDGKPWNSHWWNERLNPAGIGITGDPEQNKQSHTWETGADSAQSQIGHLLCYALGPSDAGSLWARKVGGPPLSEIDPRYAAYLDAYGNAVKATTLAELSGTWATDERYAEKIVERAASIFPSLPDQEDTTPVPTLQIDQRITTRDMGFLTSPVAWITIHNNGNPSSDRFDEATFVQGGGGDQGVLYHGAIDAGGFCQIEKFDHKGRHAGNTDGNNTSIGFEMCVGSEPWTTVKENTAQLLAAIVTGDDRLDFGTFSKDNYSLDRIREHRDWPGANPACPQRLIQTDGGAEKVIARAREIVGGTHPPAKPKPEPPPFDKMPYRDEIGNTWLALGSGMRRWTAIRQTARRQWADPTSVEVASPVKKDETITAPAMVITPRHGAWLISKAGVRLSLNDFVPLSVV